MLIRNRDYASYLVIIYNYKYEITDNGINIVGLNLELHDQYYSDYKSSIHRKIHKLSNKFYAITNSKS